jgi:peptidoglycan/xylan/chitin deacetylase (PgdA/CDA1 family)
MTPPTHPGTGPINPDLDLAGIEWSEYGSKAGAQRLMGIAKRHGLPATFCVNGRVVEKFPEIVRQIVDAGFELGGHTYAEDQLLAGLEPGEELAVIRRSVALLENASGVRPCGWLSSALAHTRDTAGFLAGEGMIWHGDYNYLDVPCRVSTPNGSIVAIPHSDFPDNRVLRGAPHDWYQAHKDWFDYLYQYEPGGFMNISLHGHFGGRPLIAAELERILRYIAGHPGVWFARHDELARYVKEHQIDDIGYVARFPFH